MASAAAAAALITRAGRRARRDPGFAAVLATLVDAPTRSAGAYRRAAASALDEQRRADALASFRDAALPTAEVQQLLGLGTPQAVHRLRSRGRVLGLAIGNATYFPRWQFSAGRIHPSLADVLDRLGRFTTDVVAADRVMRLARDELGGRSIAEALDDRRHADTAWAILDALG